MVGLIPLFAAEVLGDREVDRLPGFSKRMRWFLENRPELAAHVYYRPPEHGRPGARLLAIAPRERLVRMLGYLLDESEFLSPLRHPEPDPGPRRAPVRPRRACRLARALRPG